MLSQLSEYDTGLKPLLIDSDRSLNYEQLESLSSQLAEYLLSNNVRLLALYADNSSNWFVVDAACQLANVCIVPLPTFFSHTQLQHIFETTAIDAIISMDSGIFEVLLKDAVIDKKETPLPGFCLLKVQTDCSWNDIPEGTGKITFTSGSTGKPKGVCLSNTQLLNQANQLCETLQLHNARHLCLLPLSTLLENVAGIYTALLSGGQVFVPKLEEIGFEGSSTIDINKFTAIITTVEPQTIILTPQLLVALVSSVEAGWLAPESLKFVAVGGSRVSEGLFKKAQHCGIPAFEGYGLSECASVVSLNTPTDNNLLSSGKVLPHLAVEIVNGEIVIAGNAMLGYVGDHNSWNQDKIYSGDLGEFDKQGYLYIKGRKKNLLISSFGRNINPEWVESELLSKTAIAECILFGDARPYCSALISPRAQHMTDKQLQKLIDEVNAELPDYAQVKGWARLPQRLSAQQGLLTENGRPRRKAIQKYYRELIESLYVENDIGEDIKVISA